MRKLILAIMLLSVSLFGFGTAYAVLGVADDVPGQDIVFPIICEGQPDAGGGPVPTFGSLNTVWAIAETRGVSTALEGGQPGCLLGGICTPHTPTTPAGADGVVEMEVFVNNPRSQIVVDTFECWSQHDVISSDCQTLVAQASNSDQISMQKTLNGRKFFVGYVLYTNQLDCNNSPQDRFAASVYLNDIQNGFAAGFNGISGEKGLAASGARGLNEANGSYAVAALTVFPRYFILNSDAQTFNWWIYLLGRNQTKIGVAEFTRTLNCFICDETENCLSKNIPIPDELTIIDVAGQLPGGLFPENSYPKAGFAYCDIKESGFLQGQSIWTKITGTLSMSLTSEAALAYSLYAWSYQRAMPTGASGPLKVSVVHPQLRLYCSDTLSTCTNNVYDACAGGVQALPAFGPLFNPIANNVYGTAGACRLAGPQPYFGW